MVEIEPASEHPLPADLSDECSASFFEEMAVVGNTAEAQHVLGARPSPEEVAAAIEQQVLEKALASRDPAHLRQPAVALATAAFLRTYGSQLAVDVVAMRTALTNKLVRLADCGDPRYELKAIEMLGKHSDVGLFTERSEVTINYKDPESLEAAIKERVMRLMNADIIDITPKSLEDMDDEMGGFDKDVAIEARKADLDPEAAEQLQEDQYEDRRAARLEATANAIQRAASPSATPTLLSDPAMPDEGKRPRGRPKGSKNKKSKMSELAVST